jgi:hypothetical protein
VSGFRPENTIAETPKEAQAVVMTTTYRLPSLCSVLCVGTVLSLALCASASADDSDGKSVVTQRQYQAAVQKPKRIVYYVKSSASAIPIPLERLGGIPTTTTPMLVVGDPRISNR